MPRAKSWTARIPLILKHLDSDPQAVYTRSQVQELFVIGRSQAADLMSVAGATGREGVEATVSAANLLLYVRSAPETEAAVLEQERRVRLAQKLQQGNPALRLGTMIAPRRKPTDEYTRFRDLTDVSIEDGRLTIVFSDAADLAYKLFLLAKAEANEPGEFDRLCAETTRAAGGS